MKRRSGSAMRGMQWSFGLLSVGVFLFFLLGEILLPAEGEIGKRDCSLLEAEWERVMPDGSREAVEVPGECEAKRGEEVRIETTLPLQIEPGKWLCIRSSQQDMEIYIDGELRTSYSTQNSKPFGKTSASAYVFAMLNEADAGKPMTVVTVSESSYSGVLNPVFIGERMGIWLQFIFEFGWQLLVAIFMLILSIISIIASMILRIGYKKRIMLEYLGWGILFAAIWLISESKLRQLIFPNYSVVYSVSFFAAMLLPFPFLIYINGIQKGRYCRWYLIVTGIAVADFLLCTGLQVMNIMDFLDSMIFMHMVIGLGIILIAVTIFRDTRKGYIGEYRLAATGLLGLIVSACGEIALIYVKAYHGNGLMLCVGLIFLLIMAASQSCHDIMGLEREKQRVILAGESKTRFLANMSHEIRTPINTILGMNEMILRENRDETIQGYASNIQRDGRTLLALINDVLDFSRIESGNVHLEERDYYLASLLNDIIHVVQAKAAKKNLQVRLNIDADLPSILRGDEVRLKQILTNLLTNAVKYTKEGGITFSVQGERNEDSKVLLKMSVADTGIGIREEDMGKLFERFSRLEEKKNCSIEGTGLGLSVTKQLVERMNGEIRVQSVYGKGSLFTVRIPQQIMNEEAMGDLEKAYDEEVRAFEEEREMLYAPDVSILAVDDNVMNLEVIRGLLKQTGIQIDTATGGEECLRLSRTKKYDLIFMDHMMPEPDGIETLHLLRKESDNPNAETKVIVLTANAVAGSRDEYIKEGFTDYLSKPIEIEKLEKILKKHLNAESVMMRKKLVKTEEEVQETAINQKEEVDETKEALIDRKLGISYCGNQEEMFYDMLESFCEQGEKYISELTECHDRKDWKNYAVKVHAVKSTSLTIGAKTFSEKAKGQEEAAKEGKEELLIEQWEGFIADYYAVLAEVDKLLQDAGRKVEGTEPEAEQKGEKEHITASDFRKACEELLEHIRAYEMNEALEMIERMKELEIEGMEKGAAGTVLEQVQKAVDDFDYDSADAYLTKWLEE